MSEVAIHRCVLRIRRTSGWTWGAPPPALLDAATRALPGLLAGRLPAIADELAVPVHIREPVRIRIAATTRELAALGNAGAAEAAALRVRIAEAAAAAVERAICEAPIAREDATRGPRSADRHAAGSESAQATSTAVDAPRRALHTWWRSGAIADVLARLDDPAVERLHESLLGATSDARASASPQTELTEVARNAIATLGTAQPRLVGAARVRIAAAAAIFDARPHATPTQARAALDAVLPPSPASSAAGAAVASADVGRRTDERAVAPHPASPTVTAAPREVEIRCALPFLALAGLARAGWLDAVDALLGAADLASSAFALGAGVAAKVLAPLERGWARARTDAQAIATVCGSSEAIADAEVAAAAAQLRTVLPAVDAALRGVIARARQPGPLILWRDDRGWLLIDADGMVVLAVRAELRAALAGALGAPIFVPAVFADRETLEQIEFANLRFISDARRGRDESWRMFAGLDRPLITNDTATPPARLAAAAGDLATVLALAEELAGVLAERPALPRQPADAFESACTFAATAALADLGARLFPHEPATPVLALERFGDLSARVRFEADRLVVRIPLGRRHADLLRHGVLGEIPRVPWLAGRSIDLGGA